ncbi:M48 family metallopeptidase [Dactylosporangium sp. CS-047395]|uniref:M48 family metallopeptidase n=1 Tax=Dactylosporangium sp. CS-047395 TaxID=3239936 RepID=UPI003D8E81E4
MTGDFFFRRLGRWSHSLAKRHSLSAFGAQLGNRPGGRAASGLLIFTSLLLYALILALLALGLWLCSLSFPGFGLVLGLPLVAMAVELRPRFGRVPKYATEVTAAQAPELHRLIGQVAAALSAPMPAVYVEDDEFNAFTTLVGLRRRPVLVLGLPLWVSLPAQQRVALLGHELGHFVNGDPRRGLFVAPAVVALQRVDAWLQPVVGVASIVTRLVLGLVTGVLRAAILPFRVGIAVLAVRDGQRAEYRADRLAATVAGRTAAVDLLDVLLLRKSAVMLIMRNARTDRPLAEWPETIAKLLVEVRPNLAARRESSLDDVSLFDSHPPNGLRSRALEALPGESAAVVVTSAQNMRIDAELAEPAARSARTLKRL